jgi:hypothetical protein
MVKLQQVKEKQGQMLRIKYSITLPRLMIDRKGWKKGQDLFFIFNERGNIEITD